ncbi:HK97-gp10 family putative phage morphogenesis protein [Rhizobium sp. PL01]|uniref:HK97-gp10 family putative phage morphogenesis protein n=1 Tax=Rhizobium sp. PL01 TaxID=3085631 RepID=UPI002981F703|nr:HK97-gp10 family putative phage morphogenesis protein [Rhizobium sp. PL01]MDW5313354.1 HK97 gp10 family phage protein [Rhizobium sp. PL01]
MALKAKFIGRDQLLRRMDAISPAIQRNLADMQMKVAQEVAEKIRAYAPVDRGDYRRSIHADRLSNRPDANLRGIEKTTDPNATGVFAAWYWHFIEFGTRAHTITAKSAPMLVYDSGGQMRAARSVNHPGTAPQPHIFPAYRMMKKNIKRRLARVVNASVKKAMGS